MARGVGAYGEPESRVIRALGAMPEGAVVRPVTTRATRAGTSVTDGEVMSLADAAAMSGRSASARPIVGGSASAGDLTVEDQP